MALFKHFRGNRASLEAQPLHDGYAYFCVDDGTFHIDYIDADGTLQRKQISAKNAETLCGISLEELKAQIASQDAVILGEAQAYTDNAIANIVIPEVDLTDYATKQYVDDAITNLTVGYELNDAGVLCITFDNNAWIGTHDSSLLVNQASDAILNDTKLEVQ